MLYSNRFYVTLDQALSMNYGGASDTPVRTKKIDTEMRPQVQL